MTLNMKTIHEIDKLANRNDTLKHSSTVKCLNDFSSFNSKNHQNADISHNKSINYEGYMKASSIMHDTSPTSHHHTKTTIISPDSGSKMKKWPNATKLQDKVKQARFDYRNDKTHSQENRRTKV